MRKFLTLLVLVQFVVSDPAFAANKVDKSDKINAATSATRQSEQDLNKEQSAEMKARLGKVEPVAKKRAVNFGRHGNTAMAREKILQPEEGSNNK